jgi:hypothetical protein
MAATLRTSLQFALLNRSQSTRVATHTTVEPFRTTALPCNRALYTNGDGLVIPSDGDVAIMAVPLKLLQRPVSGHKLPIALLELTAVPL